MADWYPERRKMSVTPQEIEEARRLLEWSRELETRRVGYAAFCEERRDK